MHLSINDFVLDQIKRLSGHTADPKFLSQITVNYH